MTLIKEDWLPKPPTPASRRAALPAFATALWMLVAPFVGQARAAEATMGLEFVFLIVMFFAGIYGGSGSRFLRWFGTTWAIVAYGSLAVFIAINVGGIWPVLGLAFFVATNAPVFFRRDRALQREMLAARGGAGFLLGWACVFATFGVLAALGKVNEPDTTGLYLGIWGLLFFGIWGLAELFRVLVPPPPDAGPDWWRWTPSTT